MFCNKNVNIVGKYSTTACLKKICQVGMWEQPFLLQDLILSLLLRKSLRWNNHNLFWCVTIGIYICVPGQ